MNEHKNKNIERFVDKAMKSSKLETPSLDFTTNVMAQITMPIKSKVTVYKPLISKPVWGILVLLTIGIILFSTLSKDTTSLGLFDKFNLIKIPNLFSGFKISQTTMYSLLMFAVMLFIQIPLLKHYFNKRFEA